VLRSKSPELVQQVIWGHLCCHYAVRTLMADVAQHSGHDPDRLSFVAALRITRESIAQQGAFPPEDTHGDERHWQAFTRRLLTRLNPLPAAARVTPRHQAQDAQVARQARPPRRLGPTNPTTRLHHPDSVLREGMRESVSVSFAGVTVPDPDPGTGSRSAYRLVPMAGVMVDGNDLDPL